MTERIYTKQELALLYFPESTPVTASRHLMRWITGCPSLLELLYNSGYSKFSKAFTPLQVHYIFSFLGEP